MKKRSPQERYGRLERISMLATLGVEWKTVQDMITFTKATSPEEKFAQFRILIRTIHSCIESLVFMMKSEALVAHVTGLLDLSKSDVEKLSERKRNKDGTGWLPVKQNFGQKIRLTIRLYDLAAGGAYSRR